jgi:hypothetical protein
VKDINSTEQRVRGFCPLTPTEVGIFLKALGYPKSTPIYIAAGEIYGGDKRMAGLLSSFPNVMRKVSFLINHPGARLLKDHGSWNELSSVELYVLHID